MDYEIKEIKNADIWNDFVKEQNFVNVLSSWEWLEFEKMNAFKVFAYGIFEGEHLKGVFAFVVVKSRRGKYLFLRHSIFLDWKNSDIVTPVLSFLKDKCFECEVDFIRIAPTLPYTNEYERIFSKYGFRASAPRLADAGFTIVLDLEKSLDEIFADMRKNTRHLVRKAKKLGVEVESTNSDDFLQDFEKIYKSTIDRHKWNAFNFDYIKKQYVFFSSKGISRMFAAKYKGEILSVAIFTQFADQVIYHHSGSVHTTDHIPLNYGLMGEVIKYYKDLGLKELNLFGVCEKDDKKHPWSGISLFKRGFGGFERRLLSSYDYPITKRYYLTRLLEFLKYRVFKR